MLNRFFPPRVDPFTVENQQQYIAFNQRMFDAFNSLSTESTPEELGEMVKRLSLTVELYGNANWGPFVRRHFLEGFIPFAEGISDDQKGLLLTLQLMYRDKRIQSLGGKTRLEIDQVEAANTHYYSRAAITGLTISAKALMLVVAISAFFFFSSIQSDKAQSVLDESMMYLSGSIFSLSALALLVAIKDHLAVMWKTSCYLLDMMRVTLSQSIINKVDSAPPPFWQSLFDLVNDPDSLREELVTLQGSVEPTMQPSQAPTSAPTF